MRFLILGLNYLPESTSIGPYTADLAEYLAARGHQVRVVAGFPMAPQWKIWEGYRGRWFLREKINGVAVLRTWLYVPAQPGKAWKRILFDTSFALSALVGGLLQPRADVVIAVSPPLQLGVTAWLLARLRGGRFFLQVKDLVPDAAVAVGLLGAGSRAVRAARRLERFVYRRAAGIGVICEGFRRNLEEKGVPGSKVALLPDYLDLGFMHPHPMVNGFRARQGIAAEDFVAMYSGSVALKQGLHTLVDAAVRCDGDSGIEFCLIGEGPYLPELTARAKTMGARRMRFLPLQPRSDLPSQLAAANALVITQKRAVTDMVFPGKLLYYMASGRPIIGAVSEASETGRFIRQHAVGLVVPPEQPGALAGAVRFLKANPAEAERLGSNGRATAERLFDRNIVLKKLAERLEGLGGPPLAACCRTFHYRVTKRILDILGAALGLVISTPLLAAIAAGIKLTSTGPVFYPWRVVGKQGALFRGYKFRTMRVGAESAVADLARYNQRQGPAFKMRNDPRVTPLGRILRKFSLDELPQLWNVLKGDMSLVGPRPVLASEWEHFQPWQRRKLTVTPGAVSLWHVNGQAPRFDDWIRTDLFYIDHWSLGLDMQILLRAAGYVLKGRNC
jgi:putative colanic acid biosynthesis glycosyltransferase WcaI